MSTRSVIARAGKIEGEFSGTYHHWDGMPTRLGKTMWKLLHGHFKNDLERMLRILIDEHSAWSTIVEKSFRLKPGYSSDHKKKNPVCYCHGERSEKNTLFTHNNLEPSTDIEWLYVFDWEHNRLCVRDVRHSEEVLIELNGEEPDWAIVECGKNFERCAHYAWAHGLLPRTSNLSTQTWLGNRPLEFCDAIGFFIGGKRFAATGSGGNSDYLQRSTGASWPRNTWIASVKARNGKRLDFPVALIGEGGYQPFPGVQWVLPPTKNHPTETIVGGAAVSA